ncbi:MAG: hypothetical protein DMG57_13655 [Acidobacteria bacterium]|nr:MAG: hypothetical protein DMG57_13655 [Acidobacteriota bacterium]
MEQAKTEGVGQLRTAQLADEGGVNVETIRYYERHGLIVAARMFAARRKRR